VASGCCRIVSDLKSSTVHRNLDAKLKVMGLEVHDLLFVLLFASVMNLLFGKTDLAIYIVFLLPMTMAGVLFFAKRNKPDQYLVHLFRFYLSPGFYSAAQVSPKEDAMRARIYEG
jgi:hypothetical protein